jgi:short-subunit dehydrogenase
MLQINMMALTRLTYRLLPSMLAAGRGGILNVSSGFGLFWCPGLAAYSASKHYVTAFTESLRGELWGTGVVVSQVCPGPVDTEFDDVAGNEIGIDMPRFVRLSADRCARIALRRFRRGRALTVPGFWIGLLLLLGRATPRFLNRLVLTAVLGRLARRRRARLGTTEPAQLAPEPPTEETPESEVSRDV